VHAVSRGRVRRTPAILRELRAIRTAILSASAEQKAHREATAEAMVDRVGVFLRDALDEATPRTVVLDPPSANDNEPRTAGPSTPPEGPANDDDDEPPPKNGPRRET
jgi:hypothetical protein